MKLVVLTDSVFTLISLFLLCFVCIGHISTTKSQSVYFERSNKYEVIAKVIKGSLNLWHAFTPINTFFCVFCSSGWYGNWIALRRTGTKTQRCNHSANTHTLTHTVILFITTSLQPLPSPSAILFSPPLSEMALSL